MTQFITVSDNLDADTLKTLQESINRYAAKPGGGLMANLLKRTRAAEKQVVDLREQISDAMADADNSYQGLKVERAEHRETRQELSNEIASLKDKVRFLEKMLEEEQARGAFRMRRIKNNLVEDFYRWEASYLADELGRTVDADLPF